MTLADHAKQAGGLGAGGGKFLTQVNLAAKADTVIATGVGCEPLPHRDAGFISRSRPDVYCEVV